jgi:hypothetical protein
VIVNNNTILTNNINNCIVFLASERASGTLSHREGLQGFKKGESEMDEFLRPLLHPRPGASEEEKKAQQDFIDKFHQAILTSNESQLLFLNNTIHHNIKTMTRLYISLFIVGIVTAIFAVIKGFGADTDAELYATAGLAGLSAASFFSLTIARPLESLDRSKIFSTWLVTTLNTYWLRLLYLKTEGTQEDLEDATNDLIAHLTTLADKYAESIGKYPALANGTAKKKEVAADEKKEGEEEPEAGSDGKTKPATDQTKDSEKKTLELAI